MAYAPRSLKLCTGCLSSCFTEMVLPSRADSFWHQLQRRDLSDIINGGTEGRFTYQPLTAEQTMVVLRSSLTPSLLLSRTAPLSALVASSAYARSAKET